MKNISFIIFIFLGVIFLFNSCKKEESKKILFPYKVEFSYYTLNKKIERSGGSEYGTFSFTTWWKSEPIVEDSLVYLIFKFELNPNQPRYEMVFLYRLWYNGEGIQLNEPINLDSEFTGRSKKDYSLYFNEYDATVAYWDLDPDYDNYIILTYLSEDKKVLEGEFSFRGIKQPQYITLPYIPSDTLTYERGIFRIEQLF